MKTLFLYLQDHSYCLGVQNQSFISFHSIFDELEQTQGDQEYHVLEKPQVDQEYHGLQKPPVDQEYHVLQKPPVDQEYHGLQKPPIDQEYHGLQKPQVDQEYHGLQKTLKFIQNSSTNLENKENNNPNNKLSDFGISFSDSDSDSDTIAPDVAENLETVDGSDSRSNVEEEDRFNSSPVFDNTGDKISNIDEDATKTGEVIHNRIPSSTPERDRETRNGNALAHNAWPQTHKRNKIHSGSFIHNTADIGSFNCENILSKKHEEEKGNSYVHEENRSPVNAKVKKYFIPERDSVQEEADLMRFSSDTGDSFSDQSQNLDQTLGN